MTVVGARVLLLRPLPLLVGGTRRPAAADGGVRRELALDLGGWRVGGALFGWGVCRGRGIGGGGIREGVGCGVCGDEVTARDGGCILVWAGASLGVVSGSFGPEPFTLVWADEPLATLGALSLSLESPFRLSVGTARTGGGALDADALGVF